MVLAVGLIKLHVAVGLLGLTVCLVTDVGLVSWGVGLKSLAVELGSLAIELGRLAVELVSLAAGLLVHRRLRSSRRAETVVVDASV